ncbi:MAG: fumarylacetoacetate hydrolase family protein [Alphaproteobacteria bacterium]|nr:fumarylacetoacetate hydrolase family protein [Alphaproteobacteria bacterium]
MKLATLDDGTRDGALRVVRRDLSRIADATDIAPTLQAALDAWDRVEPQLRARAAALEAGEVASEPYDATRLRSPLPRAYEWVDGSAYISHVVLVRRARNAEPPATLKTDPLVYQGGSGVLLDPTADIELPDAGWGLDFEAEVVAILGDTPRGVAADAAAPHIKLLTLVNDVTLRNLIPPELAKGFGFFTSKPASAFGPVAVTPDELGDAWQDGRLHLPMRVHHNGTLVGQAEAGPEMWFSFHDLLAHITRTRGFTAGTLLGSGTVANEDASKGYSCIAEKRMREIIADGAPTTPFLQDGDTVRIEMLDAHGASIFGAITQRVRSVA